MEPLQFQVSALCTAIEEKNIDKIRIILKCKSMPEKVMLLKTKNDGKESPIFTVTDAEVMALLLKSVEIEHRLELLIERDLDEVQNTCIHQATHRRDTNMISLLLSLLRPSDGLSLLQVQDRHTDTALHLATFYHSSTSTISCILDSIEQSDRLALLTITEKYGETPLHKAAYCRKTEHIKCMLYSINMQERFTLLQIKDCFQLNSLHKAAYNLDCVIYMLSSVDVDDRVTLLLTEDKEGNTPLHKIGRISSDALQSVLDLINPSTVYKLLLKQNIHNSTCLHMAYSVRAAIDYVSPSEKIELLRLQNHYGATILHKLVERRYAQDAGTIRHILRSLPQPDVISILSIQDSSGATILHKSAKSQDRSLTTAILECIDKSRRLEMLSLKNLAVETPIHHTNYVCTELIGGMLESLIYKEKLSALQIGDANGDTPLHKAASCSYFTFKRIVGGMNRVDRALVLKLQNKHGSTPLHTAARDKCTKIIDCILEFVDEPERIPLLSIEAICGSNALLVVMSNHDIASFSCILKSVGLPAILQMLEIPTSTWSDIEEATLRCDREFIRRVISLIEPRDRMNVPNLLRLLQKDDNFEVYNIVCQINEELVQKQVDYISSLTSQQLITKVPEIMKIKYANGNTIIHLLAEKGSDILLKMLLASINSKHRSDYLSTRNNDDKTPFAIAANKVKPLLQWSEKQSGFYYLPTPPLVLIMYSTKDRIGADDERESLEQVLPEFDLQAKVRKDLTEEEMMNEIREAQGSDISALMVIIMSHGEHGVVCAADKDVTINDILLQMNTPSMENKPKVLLLQACQAKRQREGVTAVMDSSKSSKDPCPPPAQSKPIPNQSSTSQHVSSANNAPPTAQLNRASVDFEIPGKHFAILIATISGGYALRNTMIPIFARQLKNSENNGDIHEIFLKTHKEMHSQVQDQTPVYRTTMLDKLSLRNIFKPSGD